MRAFYFKLAILDTIDFQLNVGHTYQSITNTIISSIGYYYTLHLAVFTCTVFFYPPHVSQYLTDCFIGRLSFLEFYYQPSIFFVTVFCQYIYLTYSLGVVFSLTEDISFLKNPLIIKWCFIPLSKKVVLQLR